MKFLRSKFLIILSAFVFILFMTNDFGLVNIERTAIIMAIGIDFDKENKEYEVTAQIAIPEPSSTASGENNDSLISEKGKTIASAIDNGRQPDWYTALGGCIMIHGHGSESDWTDGCIAVENEIMDILFEYCPLRTKITILP